MPGRTLDRRALTFAYTPVEDATGYRDVWAKLLNHLQAVIAKPVVGSPVRSNAAQIEAMCARLLHPVGLNSGSTPLAVN